MGDLVAHPVWIFCLDSVQILTARTEKRQIGSRAGNTFSVATFAVDEKPAAAARKGGRDEEDREFWAALLPEAVAAHEEQVGAQSEGMELGGVGRRGHQGCCVHPQAVVVVVVVVWPCRTRVG